MKKLIFVGLVTFLMVGCGQKSNQSSQVQIEQQKSVDVAGESKVMVYYFHGKQRCKTCLTVQKVAQETIATKFGDNPEVKFVEVDISDKANQALADKYEISWSSLVLATTNSHVDLTDQAFSMALSNPQALSDFLTEETVRMLTN